MTVDELEKTLNTGKLESLYLLYGEETFLLENAVKKIKKNFGKLQLGINYILIDENHIGELIDDVETPAFGYEKKLILVKNVGLLKKEVKKKNSKISEIRDKITDYIKQNREIIEQSIVLIFIETDANKTFSFYKLMQKEGIVCEFLPLKPNQIEKRIKAICKAYQVSISDMNLKYFIETCRTNMQDLINEIRKLIEYAGKDGEITKEAIQKLAIKQIDAVIFDLTDSLGNKNTSQAMQVLDNLIYCKEPVQKILITLYNHFRKLYITKLAEKYQKSLTDSLNLKPNQMFLTTKYKKQATYFTEQTLRDLIEALIDLDSNYKIGLIDLEVGLKAILCNYCSK